MFVGVVVNSFVCVPKIVGRAIEEENYATTKSTHKEEDAAEQKKEEKQNS